MTDLGGRGDGRSDNGGYGECAADTNCGKFDSLTGAQLLPCVRKDRRKCLPVTAGTATVGVDAVIGALQRCKYPDCLNCNRDKHCGWCKSNPTYPAIPPTFPSFNISSPFMTPSSPPCITFPRTTCCPEIAHSQSQRSTAPAYPFPQLHGTRCL